ncbi:MAG: hypothetical protein KAI72_10435 [Candidatus Pacebacteria bacterium]|nr:hypothetical protein [Candidatus Paceibacterota bacterium]
MTNIIFIHGINYQTTGYSNWLFQNIFCQYGKILKRKGLAENEIEQKKAQLVQKEILWADVTTDLTNRYINLEYELYGKKKGFWNWASKKIDPLALQIMYYIKDKGDKASGEMGILDKVDKAFKSITQEAKDTIIIAHSLGSVIAFDYLFGFRKHSLPKDIKVLSFVTLGSPIPIFISAMGHVESDLTLPANIKAWHNLYDNEDGIARRCKPFFSKIDVKDTIVRTGFFPISAHVKYWQNKQTAFKIANILSKV